MTSKKIAVVKNAVKKISIPTQAQADKAKTVVNLQLGKVILQIKRE